MRRLILAGMVLVGMACSGGGSKDSTPTAPTPVLTTVVVTLSAASIPVGQTAAASVSGLDQNGAAIGVGSVTWSTGSSSIATVNASGTVTGVAPGQAQIIATSGGKQGQQVITVTAGLGGTGTVVLHFRDGAGAALQGVTYTLTYPGGSQQNQTGNDGVSWSPVPAGTVSVTASKAGYNNASASGTLAANATLTLNVVLNATGGGGGGSAASINNDEPVAAPGNSLSIPAGGCVNAGGFSVPQNSAGWTMMGVSKYVATFWILDATNMQNCLNGAAFSGYLLIGSKSQFGVSFGQTILGGTWYVAVKDDRTTNPSAPMNVAGAEISQQTVTGFTAGGSLLSYAKSLNPTNWYGQQFTVTQGQPIWLDGSSTGGKVVIMNLSDYQSFVTTYANGYTGGTYHYLIQNGNPFCNLNNADAPEDCDLPQFLPPGTYGLVAFNDSQEPQAFVGYARAFTPASSAGILHRHAALPTSATASAKQP